MLLLVLGHFSTWAQPGESWYNLYFPVSKSQVDAEFGNNQQSMGGISTLLCSLADRGVDSVHVALHSYCSPEGRIGFNEELVRDRLANTKVSLGINGLQNGNAFSATREVTNVPVRRNYRTQIVGNVFTDEGTFNVTIVPTYETPDYDKNL